MRPHRNLTVIFDLDGTIANTAAREHFLLERPQRWNDFHEALDTDIPNPVTVELYHQMIQARYKVGIVTGRPEAYRERTREWLSRNSITLPHWMEMRKAEDNRPAVEFKAEAARSRAVLRDIWLVVDNDPFVCRGFAALGVTALQVHQAAPA